MERPSTHGELARQLQIALHAANLGVWEWDLRTHEFHYSDRARAIFGFSPDEEITRQRIREILHPEDLPVAQAQAARGLDPSIERREPYRYRIHRADTGELRWIHAFGEPVFEAVGGDLAAIKYIGTLQDVTEEVLAKQRLVEHEARLRLAIEAGGIAVWELNLATQTVTHSPELNRLCGFPPDAHPTLEELRSRYAPGERERLEREGAEARARGDTRLETEIHHIWPDGTEKWLWLRAQLAPGETGYGGRVIGTLVDITDQKKRQEQQALLISELQHRIKNSFSVMHALVSQTLRGEIISDEARTKLFQRFEAMSGAHEVISSGAWEAASLTAIVERSLSAFTNKEGQIVSRIEEVALSPRAALSFSLVLHELLTNSVKYGSLASEAGRLEIGARLDDGMLRFEWRESGGPAIDAAPVRSGFGTQLTDRLFAVEFKAQVERQLRPEGLYLALHVPAGAILASAK